MSLVHLSTLLLAASLCPILLAETASARGLSGHSRRAWGSAWSGSSKITKAGQTGVAAMQISVVDDDHILIYDKQEGNPLKVNGNSVWSSIYTISTQKATGKVLQTNSFCAGGGWLGNGTLVSVGGDVAAYDGSDSGIAAIRLFTPCNSDKCNVLEYPGRVRLTSNRWYASTVRLTDGSILILGGTKTGGYNNYASTENPTFEFFPPKGDGLAIYSKFLHESLNTNLFPVTELLPDGRVFVAANKLAMLYDWKINKEYRLPSLPGGLRATYPASPASVLLPLTIANGWTPSILLCGGTTANTDKAPSHLSATKNFGSDVCVRMELTTAGIKAGWQIEHMPEIRIMGDGILTPDGKVLLINGGRSGVAGYGNVKDEVGASNAAHPDHRATLYDPIGREGKRFATNFPASNIERLYHSSATLLPDGRIFVAGSNPNADVSTKTYKTHYEVEMLSPPYVSKKRPSFSGLPKKIYYGKTYQLGFSVPSGTKKITAVLMDLGYSTHGVHMNHRLVELKTKVISGKLAFTAPKTSGLYPPGYGWLYILADGVPSKGKQVMMGSGASPPVSQAAIKNMLKKTSPSA